jgi:hypothetical protein
VAIQNAHHELKAAARLLARALSRSHQESRMPKQKTKSGAKKRFKFTANGHIKVQQAGNATA